MSKKENDIELKIYELLGIKTFKKMAFKLRDFVFLLVNFKMPKEERHKFLYEKPSNYIMKKGKGIQDLQDFKKKLLINAGIHLSSILISIGSLLICIPYFLKITDSTASLLTTILKLAFTICYLFIVINIYCVML